VGADRERSGPSPPAVRRPLLVLWGFVAVVLILAFLVLRVVLSPASWARQWLDERWRMVTHAAAAGPVVVEQVQRLGRLETCRFNEQVVVQGNTKGILPTWIAGDRLLFRGKGEVVAGVDLGRLRPEDVTADRQRVTVHLPPGEIFHVALDNQQSEVFDRQTGIFTGPDRNLETRVRAEAEARLRSAALEAGILATADTNAREALRPLLTRLGFREIEFR
jgi:Protein of unknown function (DUF4230)